MLPHAKSSHQLEVQSYSEHHVKNTSTRCELAIIPLTGTGAEVAGGGWRHFCVEITRQRLVNYFECGREKKKRRIIGHFLNDVPCWWQRSWGCHLRLPVGSVIWGGVHLILAWSRQNSQEAYTSLKRVPMLNGYIKQNLKHLKIIGYRGDAIRLPIKNIIITYDYILNTVGVWNPEKQDSHGLVSRAKNVSSF